MPFRSNNPITRDELLSRFFPQYHPVTTFNSGLSGGSFLIEHQGQRFVVRQPHDPDAPQSAFLRQYRALSQLPACIAPKPHLYLRDWMVVDYLPGAVKTYLPDTNELAGLLYYLHQQPRFGWRITLLPLLELYWQQSDPARRTVGWLRMLKRLRKAREQVNALVASMRDNQDVEAGEVASALLLDGLLGRIAIADDEYDEMPIQDVIDSVAKLQRTSVYKARMSKDRSRLIKSVEANLLARLQTELPERDPELLERLQAIVADVAREEAQRDVQSDG
mgnify:CR=1 FL=1